MSVRFESQVTETQLKSVEAKTKEFSNIWNPRQVKK